jgi:hypothetical protein
MHFILGYFPLHNTQQQQQQNTCNVKRFEGLKFVWLQRSHYNFVGLFLLLKNAHILSIFESLVCENWRETRI